MVMTSSQTVMAHNVPRKIGQQFTFLFLYTDKSSNPTCCFLFPVVTDFDECMYCSVLSGGEICDS